MRFNVAQLLKEPIGSTRTYQLEQTFTGSQRIVDSARGQVRLMRTHQGILVAGELNIAVTLACSRCLDPFERCSTIAIEEEYFPTVDINTGKSVSLPENTDDGLRIDSSHIIDLSEALRQYAITEEPMKPLCQEHCRGLCPVCGVNQNEEECDCRSQETDPRWGALAAILERRNR
jgi:uncharacterized protein